MLHLCRVWPARAIQERVLHPQPRPFLLSRRTGVPEKAFASVLPSVPLLAPLPSISIGFLSLLCLLLTEVPRSLPLRFVYRNRLTRRGTSSGKVFATNPAFVSHFPPPFVPPPIGNLESLFDPKIRDLRNTISSRLARAARPIRMRLRSVKLHSNVIHFIFIYLFNFLGFVSLVVTRTAYR